MEEKKIKRKSLVVVGLDMLANKIEKTRSSDGKKENEEKKDSPLGSRKYRRSTSANKPKEEGEKSPRSPRSPKSPKSSSKISKSKSKLSKSCDMQKQSRTSSPRSPCFEHSVSEKQLISEETKVETTASFDRRKLFTSSERMMELPRIKKTQKVGENGVAKNDKNKEEEKEQENEEGNNEVEVENKDIEDGIEKKDEDGMNEEDSESDEEYDETDDEEVEGNEVDVLEIVKNELQNSEGESKADNDQYDNNNEKSEEKNEEKNEEKEEEIVENAKEEVFDDSHINYEKDMWGVPDNEKSIVFNSENCSEFQIRAATLGKLVEKISAGGDIKVQRDHQEYLKIFFMTYRSYADPIDILTRLISRFKGPDVPEGKHITDVVPNIYQIRKSVCISLVHWFTNHYRDFGYNNKLLEQLQTFIVDAAVIDADNKETTVKYLDKMIQKKANKGTYTSLFASDIMIDKSNCPEPILPKDLNNATFMQLDELEIARQLTIAEYHIYAEIQPVELQDLAWSKPHLKERAPNVLEMIERFNKFSNRCSTLIVSQPKVKDRKKVIEKLVKIAEHLLEFNSFNMTMAIMSGFSNSAIFRMKHSFDGLSKKACDTMHYLNEVLSSNQSYKVYREVTSNMNPPAIPFLGVYLSDLTFVDEGNPNKVNGLINFRKKQLEYDVIVQVLKYQNLSYNFKMVPKISDILNRLPILKENDMYKLSLEYEPRNAKKKDLK